MNSFETRDDWREALHIVWKYDLQGVASRVIDGQGYIFAQYSLKEVLTPADMGRLKELGWFYDDDMGAFYQFE